MSDLAAAVLDGDVIDWPAAQARLRSRHEQSVAAELRTLSGLGTSTDSTAPRPESRRLPRPLEIGRALAIVIVVAGFLAEAFALSQAAVTQLIILISLVVIFGFAAAVLDVGGTDRRARALGSCFWMMAAAFSTPGLRWLLPQFPTVEIVKLLASLHPDAFFAAGLWQFARDFPVLARFGALDRLCLAALRVTLAIGVALVIANLVPVVMPAWTDAMEPLRRTPGFGAWFWILTFLSALPALVVIAWRGRSAVGQEAARVRLFLYALSLTVLPVVIEVSLESLLPWFSQLMRTPTGHWWGAVVVYTPMFVLPLATAYAVVVDNVLEVRVVVQRALRYLLARWLVLWGAAVPFALLVGYLVHEAARPLAQVMADPPARALAWVNVSALVLLGFRGYAVRALDRWVLPGIDDPSMILAQLTERLNQTRTPLEVTVALADAVERALQTPASPYRSVDTIMVPVGGGAVVQAQSLVRVLLEGSREPCLVSANQRHSYYSLLSERDRTWIAEHGIVILLPVVSARAGGALLGMVTLKDRRNALTFSPDDIRFLRAATAAASLACDAAQLETPSTAGESSDEFGLQCTRCGRVEQWTASPVLCACGAVEWEAAALPKRLLGRFEISRRVGAGGMGIVYGATDLRLGREVAVKTLTKLSEDAAQRQMIEARAMADLAHQHVAVLYGAEIWRGTPLLIIEFMAGGTLASRLTKGTLASIDALRLGKGLAGALVHMHRADKYHGDIKPSNIGFTREGVVKFLDFGLSRSSPRSHHDVDRAAGYSATGPIAGTWAYMSPEVRDGASPGPGLDVWALTVVLFECLTGKHPFASASPRASVDLTSALRRLPPLESAALAAFFERAFARAALRYPDSAAALLAELERLDAPAAH